MKFSRSTDVALLILRLTFGGLMIYGHGWGKLTRLMGAEEISFADPFGLGPVASLVLAVFAEVLCAFLLMLGLFTRWVTIPLIITMLAAVFYAHAGDPFKGFEKALLYLITYFSLLIAGGGYYSLDGFLQRKKSN